MEEKNDVDYNYNGFLAEEESGASILDPATKRLMSYRSRELRNFLIQKVGFKKADIDKIIDREELRALAIDYRDKLIVEVPGARSDYDKGSGGGGSGGASFANNLDGEPNLWYDFLQLFFMILSKLGLLISIVLSFAVLIYCLTWIRFDNYTSFYSYFDDKAEIRLVTLRNAIKRRWWKPAIFFSITSALSLYVALLRWRVLFSWTPVYVINNFPAVTEIYRVFDVLPCLSLTLPRDTKMIGNLNLDLGPLIFQYIINKVRERLDLYGMKRSWENYNKKTTDENNSCHSTNNKLGGSTGNAGAGAGAHSEQTEKETTTAKFADNPLDKIHTD